MYFPIVMKTVLLFSLVVVSCDVGGLVKKWLFLRFEPWLRNWHHWQGTAWRVLDGREVVWRKYGYFSGLSRGSGIGTICKGRIGASWMAVRRLCENIAISASLSLSFHIYVVVSCCVCKSEKCRV